MKKELFFIITIVTCVLFCFEGCTIIQERKAREQFVQDSIRHAQDSILAEKARAALVADSLNNVRLDSLSLIAWGKAKFGMSLKEILATETFANCKKPEYFYGEKLTYYDKDYVHMKHEDIAAYNESFHLKTRLNRIAARLKDDELYMVVLESHCALEWSRLSDVISDCDFFVRQFSKKNGDPVFLKDSKDISSLSFSKGEEFLYARFEIKNKSISIRMGEDSYLRKPRYKIYISNSDFPQKPHIETKEEIAAKEKKEQQRRFSGDNSF